MLFQRLLARSSRGAALAATLIAIGGPARGQSSDLFADARFLDPEPLRELVAEGETRLPVMVNLIEPTAVREFSDWRNKPLADAHRVTVAALLESVIGVLPPSEIAVRHRMENQLMFSGRVTPEGLRLLLATTLVKSIEYDMPIRAFTDQGITLMNGDGVRSVYDGSGMSIAIVDSGIDYNHAAMGNGGFPNGKVLGGTDFGDGDSDPIDTNGHGTAVAGIAAGDVVTSGDYIGGVAPGARLYALKVTTGSSGSGSLSDVAASYNWCVTHQDDDPSNPILVINTSFGGGQFASACTGDGLHGASTNAVDAGMTIFCASGNDGYCAAMASPACVAPTISVGAVYDANIGGTGYCIDAASCIGSANGGCTDSGWACFDNTTAADQVTCYSNSASFLDILAPSDNASTPTAGGGYTTTFNGTSAASPYAAGAAALLIDAAQDVGITLTSEEIRGILSSTGNNIVDAKSSISTPRVNLGNAVDNLASVWVDFAYSGTETGSWSQPYNTLAEGLANVSAGGALSIRTGSTSVTPTINQHVILRPWGGSVTIGL